MVVMIVLMFSFLIIYESSLTVNDAATENFVTENKIYHTSINITSASEIAGNDDFTFILASNDEEKLWDFENFDVIIEYDGMAGASDIRRIEVLTYSSGICTVQPAVGNWCINSWNNDNMDPNILNNGESITIWARVNDQLANGETLIITVATDLGVVASYSETIG
jgi:hypothetical protein